MTDIQQAEDSVGIFIILLTTCFLGFIALSLHEPHRYVHGFTVIADSNVYYKLNDLRGELHYNIGRDSTQPRVLLCRVYSSQYARCVETTTGSSVTPLSNFDALLLEKLYEEGKFNQKPYSINYSSESEVP